MDMSPRRLFRTVARRHPCLSLAAVLMAIALAGGVASAQDYPAHKVTMVVPTGPGGGMEMMARLFAAKMEERLGKPFVIENRAGAGGIIGTNAVAKAACRMIRPRISFRS